MATTIVVEFRSRDGLRAFVEQLVEGRAVVRSRIDVELLEEVGLVVGFDGRRVELGAVVAHPRLPAPDGSVGVALAVNVDAAQRRVLEGLVRGRTRPPVIDGFSRSDRDGTTPLVNRAFDLPEPTPARGAAIVSFAPRDTPVGGRVAARPHRAETPVDPVERLEGHGSTSPGQYRVLSRKPPSPDRSMRAHDYFEAARADLASGALELARSNLNLAIAYNPTEPAYRELLAEVERMRVRSR